MSRSNPNEQAMNPAKFFFEWNGADGGFKYYNKEDKKNIQMPYPFTFLVLDICITMKGYNEPENKGYWSNEVKKKDLTKATFTVRSKSGTEMVGSYKECKEKLGSKGLDYVQSVYILYKHKGVDTLANLQLKGAAIKPWIDFCKTNDVYRVAVSVNEHTKEKKGRVDFVAPVFKAVDKIKPETQEKAIEFDKILQAYLAVYFENNRPGSAVQVESPNEQSTATTQAPAETYQKPVHAIDESAVDFVPDEDDVPF